MARCCTRLFTISAIFGTSALLGLCLTACGGGASGSPAANNGGQPAGTEFLTTPPTVSSVLKLSFSALPHYTTPALPAYYTDRNAALGDNTPTNSASSPAASDRTITLGRVLFYDKNLSTNNRVSCATCHQQASGFSDPARFSTGVDANTPTSAHAMRLGNVRYFRSGKAFWDRRADSLELQASQPMTNPIELGFDNGHGGMAVLLSKLQTLPYYPDLFSMAFGNADITQERITTALAQFERSIVSTDSRWDRAYASVYAPNLPNRGLDLELPGLSAQENRGRALFMGGAVAGVNCAACHVPPTFSLSNNARSNGLDRGESTLFKAPSLKNIALSSAFMHDGRFSTLAQVVEHYNSGVQAGPALDNRLTNRAGNPQRHNLSAQDKAALVAFMATLTDTRLVADEKFSDPFK
jgi:cytochrome c peroxidase